MFVRIGNWQWGLIFFKTLEWVFEAMTQLFCVVLVCTHINWIIYLQEICIPEDEGFRVNVK